jgi:hypothetical protein
MRNLQTLSISLGASLMLWGLASSCFAAQETEVEDASVESARAVVRSSAVWLASGVDSWFGNKPFSEGGAVSDGQISLNLYHRQDQGTTANVLFNARFKLPNVEQHTYFFTGRDNTAGVITDKPSAFATKQKLLVAENPDDNIFFAGFGRWISESVDARAGFQGGLKLFAQGRYRQQWTPSENDEFEFSQTVFATAADRIGSSTVLSYQHRHASGWVGRWLNAITVTQADTNAEWNSSLGVYRPMGEQRLLALELLASSKQNTGLFFTDYGVQVRWEQPVHRNRLMGEAIFGHFWPQSLDPTARSTAWAVGAGVKMRF